MIRRSSIRHSPGRGVFGHRSFTAYWTGGLVSNVGTWLQNVTASVLVLTLTGSPFWVGVLNLATFAPVFLFSMYGGVLSDRYNRRRIVIVTHALAMSVTGLLAAATFLGRTTGAVLIGASFLVGSCYAFAKPTLSALLPALVPREDVARATAVNTLQFNLGQAVGSVLASLILVVASPAWAFALNTLTFLGPICAMLFIRVAPRTGAERSRAAGFGELLEGLRFIGSRQVMLLILGAIVLVNGMVEALRTLAPSFAIDVLAFGESGTGLIVAGNSVGVGLGLVFVGLLTRVFTDTKLLYTGFALQGVGVVLFSLAPSLPAAVAAASAIGLGFSFLIPLLNAALQHLSPEGYRGRVMSSFAMAHLGLRPLGAMLAGSLASVVPARATMLAFAGLAVVGLRLVRRIDQSLPSSAAA